MLTTYFDDLLALQMRHFLLGLLSQPELQHSVCRALGTLLSHNPSMTQLFIKVSICGPNAAGRNTCM